jgi:prefoldin subunit 5
MTREYFEAKLAVLQHEHRQIVSQMESIQDTHEQLKAGKQAHEGAIEFVRQLLADMPADAPAVVATEAPKD